MIELILAEDIIGVAKTGDTVVLKDDNTFEIQKSKDWNPAEDGEKSARQDNYDKEEERLKKEGLMGRSGQSPQWAMESLERDEAERKKRKEKEAKKEYDPKDFPPTKQQEDDFKAYSDKMHARRIEADKNEKKSYDPRIEKFLPNDKVKAWAILEKFNASNPHFDANEVLKEFINKVATCPDVTEKFDKIMEDWMRDGEADVSTLEKIINSCKTEGGNVVVEGEDKVAKSEHSCSICDVEKGAARKLQMLGYARRLEERNNSKAEADKKEEDSEDVEKAERTPEQLKEMEAALNRQRSDDEDTKIKPIGKSITDEIVKAITKLH